MTITELYKKTIARFEAADVPDAANDARLLMEHFFGVTRSDLMVHGERRVDEQYSYEEAVERRCKREPLQYIIGSASFMGLDFTVDSSVLVPRADTEILVEELLKDMHSGSRIMDMCTGSGCILISLMNYSNDCEGVGVDLSENALAVARINAEKIIPEKRVEFLHSDLFGNVPEGEKYDIIVSNPPYIATDVIEDLMPEVKDYEPRMALDGTADGLFFYRRIIEDSEKYLKCGGILAFEIGYDQGQSVKQLMLDQGFIEVETVRDYSGLDRVVKGIKAFHYDKEK